MIQRIQSLLLFIIFAFVTFSFALPLLELKLLEETFLMYAYHTYSIKDAQTVISNNIGIGVLQILISSLALLTIFFFKKRQLQIKLCKLNLLLVTIQIVAIVMYLDVIKETISPTNTLEVFLSLKIGIILPLLSIILLYLAIYFIKKDDELVRSADRLR
ncbi:MAG: DUF4293 family protein [Flavobacteriales bacterium]|nr:DUF4293 family protein [Flavobacteriales bacterium]